MKPSPTSAADEIPVACASDHRYLCGLLTTLWSLCEHASDRSRLRLHILDISLLACDREALRRMLAAAGISEAQFSFHAVPTEQLAHLPQWRGSWGTYARLLLPDLLPNNDFAIYTDIDTLWLRDVAELWALRERRHREPMAVAFAINRNYIRPLGTALTSLLLNNPGPVEAIILSADLDEAAKAPLVALQRHFPELTLRFPAIDMPRLDGLQMNHALDHISRETFFRYLLPEQLPDLDRVLYLDADLIVCAALDALWATPLEGAYAAGVEDSYIRRIGHDRELGLTEGEPYINAGVLLLNLKAMRQAGITKRLFALSAASSLRFMDQDALNLAFRGHLRVLPERYNVTADSLRRKVRPFRGHPAILHYTSPWKPWQCRVPLASWRHEAYRRHFERLAMDEAEAQALRAQAVAYVQEVHAPARCQARLRELIRLEVARYRQ